MCGDIVKDFSVDFSWKVNYSKRNIGKKWEFYKRDDRGSTYGERIWRNREDKRAAGALDLFCMLFCHRMAVLSVSRSRGIPLGVF